MPTLVPVEEQPDLGYYELSPEGRPRITVTPNAPAAVNGGSGYADRLAPFLPAAAQQYQQQPQYLGPATVLDNGDVAYSTPQGLTYTDNTRHEVQQDETGNYHVYEKAPPPSWGAQPYVPPTTSEEPAERAAARVRAAVQPAGGRREGALTYGIEHAPQIAASMSPVQLPPAGATDEQLAQWGFRTAAGLVGPGGTLVPEHALGMAGSRMRPRMTPTTEAPAYMPPSTGATRTLTPVEHDPFAWTGAAPVKMTESAPEDFGAAMQASKTAHKYGESLDDLPERFEGLRTHLSADGTAGYAMTDDGNIKYVFKHPNSPHKAVANSMLAHAVQNGGNRLDAFDPALPSIYSRSGFRAVARLPWDDAYAPKGWNYARDGRPDVVFMVHDPYHGLGYSKLDGTYVKTADEGFAIQKAEADAVQQRLAETRQRFSDLSDRITGLKGIGRYLTPAEQDMVTSRNAKSLVRVFSELPFSAEEMASVAYSARAKRGWYRQSAQALVNIFGAQDAPRFTALLAALSPQTGVEDNAINALNVWTAWKRAGSPQDSKKINEIMEASVQQSPDKPASKSSVLPAWRGNALRALMSKEPHLLNISGPKVNSFAQNLRDAVHEVTNDAWMANYGNIDQALFQRSAGGSDPYGSIGVKSPGYMAMSSRVRQAADVLSRRTGEVWTPAEIQETVWSWAKTLFEKAYRNKGTIKDATVEKLLQAGNITHEEIANTPDFATLFTTNVYRKILEQGGYGEQLKGIKAAAAARGSRAGGAPSHTGTPLSAQGSGLAEPAFREHLYAAGRRLDQRRAAGLPLESE